MCVCVCVCVCASVCGHFIFMYMDVIICVEVYWIDEVKIVHNVSKLEVGYTHRTL